MIDLKPCPFCGGKAKLRMFKGKDFVSFGVFCLADQQQGYQHGHSIGNYDSQEEAIADWNRRGNDE